MYRSNLTMHRYAITFTSQLSKIKTNIIQLLWPTTQKRLIGKIVKCKNPSRTRRLILLPRTKNRIHFSFNLHIQQPWGVHTKWTQHTGPSQKSILLHTLSSKIPYNTTSKSIIEEIGAFFGDFLFCHMKNPVEISLSKGEAFSISKKLQRHKNIKKIPWAAS